MAKGDPVTSPYVWQDWDNNGNTIKITVTFDNTTRVISGITVFRDPNCAFTRFLIGTGADGSPSTTNKVVNVPAGTTVLTQGQLNTLTKNSVTTIEDFLSFQIATSA